ncbi:HpcH/HpaI aldolase family protein [Lysinibacillus endophyticus]|uniref:HpcH/HpaI aldolase family protein n=1 Tax=Ureibacillus endophyticus TaxID=1978490 RepID=UPI0020A0D674|nr:aldolase/citrate lyase family protein [Lysinibacillus endophyticus]MCP1146779.1 aldolase/citrate lyase family protein [Lysinibacillus endophyticus]
MNNKADLTSNEKIAHGMFLGVYSPALVEMCSYAGFDFIIFDNEHGAFSDRDLEEMIRTADAVDLLSLVRVSYDESSIQKALDRGAKGIHVPMVNSKLDALKVIQKAMYPPLGNRGVAYSHRAAKYGQLSGRQYLQQSNEDIFVAIHLETYEAFKNIDEILQVPGIDLIFIGLTDLSVDMGYPNNSNHPEVQAVVEQIYQKAKQANIAVGEVASNEETAQKAVDRGAKYVALVGVNYVMNALKKYVQNMAK